MSSALIQQGLAALRSGDVAAARRVFESALAEGESGQVLEGLGEALYLGREYVAAVARRPGPAGTVSAGGGGVGRRAGRGGQRPGRPRGLLHQALAGFAQAQLPMELARTRLELARALAEEVPEVAVAEARAALVAFERLQAASHADTARALLRSLGVPTRTGPGGAGTLTGREVEVLRLVAAGLSNQEIATALAISEHTHGSPAPAEHLRQDRRAVARRCHRLRLPARPDLPTSR